MNRRFRLPLAVVGVLVLVVVSVFTASGSAQTPPEAHLGSIPPAPAVGSSLPFDHAPAAVTKCSKVRDMQASNPSLWFATTEDGEVEEPLREVSAEGYPAGTVTLAAGINYQCIPKNTTIAIIFYRGGTDSEPTASDKMRPKPSNEEGTLLGYFELEDMSPLPEGEWQVQWYANKTLISQGQVMVGGEVPDGEGVTAQGVILDGKTKKPIKKATFYVLRQDASIDDWISNGYPEDAVYSSGQTDAKGGFVCDKKLARGQSYPVLATARGYRPSAQQDFFVAEDQEDPMELTIKLYK